LVVRNEARDPDNVHREDDLPPQTPRGSGQEDSGGQENTRVFELRSAGPPERLDIFIHTQLPEFSRAFIQQLIEDGYVKLKPARKTVKRAMKVGAGSVVRVEVPPPRKINLSPIDLPVGILYEDPHIAVIDKPGNLAVHPSPNQACDTLVNALLYHLRDLSSIAGVERPGIVHRLDKETSGVLIVAKNDFAHRALARQFKERIVHKTYLAIVRGEPRQWEGRVEHRLGKSYSHSKKQMVRMDGTGREAVTDYRVLEKYQGYALLEVYPHTGRTHQIRVHLSSQRLPVACDKLYGREKRIFLSELRGDPRGQDEVPILDRQALHAARLTVRHPLTQEEQTFSAGLHEDMLRLLRTLERHRSLGRGEPDPSG
jgi:23S rRNA pseudouridine1911/1915/1917 synthase